MKRKTVLALIMAILSIATLTFAVGCVEDVDEHTHTWATEWSRNETEHWRACTDENCDVKSDVESHGGGTATCKTKAKCAVCGAEYGELNAENHESEEFEYVSNGNGTHKKAYKCCDATAVESEECSGGTATCKTKAKCALCGGEHGELNAENHEGDEFAYAPNGDGATHKKTYKCRGATAVESEDCSGGTATCVKKAECTLCGAEYGKLSEEHVWATEWSRDDTNHWHACTVEGCTAKNDNAAHFEGTATCKTKAVCSACETAYGNFDAANHTSEEFTYTANNDNTHKKAYKCCGAVVTENEECSGGAATCVKKAVCERCGAEYGDYSTEHAYADGLDTSDEEYDYKKCVCGKVDREHGFKKTVNTDNQHLVMTSETFALDLDGVSDYASVKSIMLGEANLGTNISALEFGAIKTDEKQHGANLIKVIVTDADGLDHEVAINVILVTKLIKTEDELKELLYAGANADTERYGYYILENDITYTANRNFVKFCGTFDGNGKSISVANMLNGLFSYTVGSTIKNLTVKATYTSDSNNYKTVISRQSTSGAKFVNVTVVYEGGTDLATVNGGGFLFGNLGCDNVSFEGLTVSAVGKKIGALFGAAMTNTTFANCVVYADEVACLAGKADGTGKVDFADVTGIVQREIEVKEIELWQETPSLNYGDMFEGKTVADISCGNYSFGQDLSSLAISDELKADKQKHGYNTLCIKFEDGSSVYLTVILVTGEIKTVSDFNNAALISTDDSTAKFGYYKLANDIAFTGNVNGGRFWDSEMSSELGFRGTIDGNGFTISTAGAAQVYNGGFFGLIGKGAVIKNVTFTVSMASGAVLGVFGSQGHDATIQDVIVNFTVAPKYADAGAFFARFSGTMTYKNVTVNAAGQDLQTIFGNSMYSNVPKCENVVVNAKSLVAIGKVNYAGGGTNSITSLTGFTFNETNE